LEKDLRKLSKENDSLMQQHRVLYFGCGKWQKQISSRLKSEGISVTVFCPEASDDADLKCDLRAVEKIGKFVSSHSFSHLFCDSAESGVLAASKVGSMTGAQALPGLVKPEIFTDKLALRDFCREERISQPRFWRPESHPPIDFLASIGVRRLVRKPQVGQGSQDVEIFGLEDYSSKTGSSRLLEEFIEGQEFTVEVLTLAGNSEVLAVSKKSRNASNPAVSDGLLFCADPKSWPSSIVELCLEFIEKAGVKNAILHAEIILATDGSPYLIEIAARGGGTGIYPTALELLTGRDVVGELTDSFLGTSIARRRTSPFTGRLFLGFLRFGEGLVTGLGQKPVPSKCLIDFGLRLREGEATPSLDSDTSRHAYFWIAGETSAEISDEVEALLESVNVEIDGNVVRGELMAEPNWI
jgi:hypothetical protein